MKYQTNIYMPATTTSEEVTALINACGAPPCRIEKADPPRDNADLGEGCTLYTYIRDTEEECNDILHRALGAGVERLDTYVFTYTPVDEAFHLAEKLANA